MCSPLVALSAGLSAFQGLAMRAAAQDAARQAYEVEVAGIANAETDKRNKQAALMEQQSDKEKISAQDKFAKSIDSLRARASLLASERAGISFGLILQENERQAANYRESIRQSLESARRQHNRSIQQTESQYQSLRNQYRSQTQQAYNQIPSLGSILLGAASSGLQTQLSLNTG
mgnify:CR=1 FL=1|tara:strand:- start:426 stop:950 length:525 start_codon:yes stop_codon:yes gene_type:complete